MISYQDVIYQRRKTIVATIKTFRIETEAFVVPNDVVMQHFLLYDIQDRLAMWPLLIYTHKEAVRFDDILLVILRVELMP
jgi:hypothetical protein